jgi:hypothetical protein
MSYWAKNSPMLDHQENGYILVTTSRDTKKNIEFIGFHNAQRVA